MVNGFGWMNYKRSKNELSIIAKKIFEYQFKREALEVYNGADTIEILKYGEWEKRCKKLLDTFFSRDGESCGIILFPDTEIELQNQTSEVEIWQRVMSTLNAWCKTSGSEDATGLIIRNYNLKDHIYFCGITEDEIRDIPGFKDSKNMFSFQKSDERFLAFNTSLKIILIIRLVNLVEGESELLQNEVGYCIDEVNLLCLLLKDELTDTGIIVTGLVAYSGENAHSQSACENCGNIIFPIKIFDSIEIYKTFWKIFVKEKDFEDLVTTLASSRKNDKVDLFEAVASKIIGYLAHFQFLILEKPILPIKKNSPTGDIKQAELLLDRYQMEIAYSTDKRVWLEGNYGTGKTVVALKKLELLSNRLKEKEVIYYVNFAKKSPLDFLMKQKFQENENIRAVRGEFSLLDTINRRILPGERDEGTQNIHLIVDEYNLAYLSIEEARSLGQIFAEEKKFLNSTVLIANQPIEIGRVDNFYDEGLKRKFSPPEYDFEELIEIMGFKLEILDNVMRTTVEINNLTEITQEYLSRQSNVHVRQQHYNISSNLSKVEERRFQKTLFKVPQSLSTTLSSYTSSILSDSIKNARSSPPCQPHKETSHDLDKKISKGINSDSLFQSPSPKPIRFSFQNASPKRNSSVNLTSDDSSNSATSSTPFQTMIDFFHLHKIMQTIPVPEDFAEKGSYQETVTKCHYTCDSQIGHGIKGPLPQLIKFVEPTDHFEQVALIALILANIIKPAETKPKRTAVIHFEPYDPPLWLKSLFQLTKFFPNLSMTTKTEEFLADTAENLVLVKNQSFVRGLEFSDVLLILDSDEHHLRHFIPEAIARCRSNLKILIRPSIHRNNQSGTVADLVDKWERHNQDEPVVSILKIGFCCKLPCKSMRNHRRAYCVDETDASYKVHKNYKYYRDLLNEIKITYVQDMLPDSAKYFEEAKAL